ncbi:MAG TPA: M20 family metallopeptidase [Negativicutes bacterium]|nr:M20 family metallopeptidase [Negativicutes bacterium]
MTNNEHLKDQLVQVVDEIGGELNAASQYIFNNPELGFQEFKAVKTLTSLLTTHGFHVETGVGGLETAFIASYGSGSPVVAFMGEYDALPELGHACGHNIIGTAAAGAAIGLSKVMQAAGLKGTVKMIGTPAEEGGGGKILLLERGVFEGVDAALLVHPTDASSADDMSYASQSMEYVFYGKASHAAAYPWGGVSALSGVIELFNMTNALRLHLKDRSRIHGIITDGGTVANIIPEKARAVFSIRALEHTYLHEMLEKVNRCAEAAAMATGTRVECKPVGLMYKNIKNNKLLVQLMQNNFDRLGEPTVPRSSKPGMGSTDVGNVTHELPASQSYVGIGDGGPLSTHSSAFAEKSGSAAGQRALLVAAKTLAMTGIDIMSNEEIVKEMQALFQASKQEL